MSKQKTDKLAVLWTRFEKSGLIQDYLKYQKAKLAASAVPSVKTAPRKKASV